MPFKSRAQQAYLFIHHPKIAKKFAQHTSKKQYKTMPARVKKKRRQ